MLSVYEFGKNRPYSWRIILLMIVLSLVVVEDVNRNIFDQDIAPMIFHLFGLLMTILVVVFTSPSKFLMLIFTSFVFFIMVLPNSNTLIYNKEGKIINPKFVLFKDKITFREKITFKVIYDMGNDFKQEFCVILYPQNLDTYDKTKKINGEKYLINSSLQDFFYGFLSPYENIIYEIKKGSS